MTSGLQSDETTEAGLRASRALLGIVVQSLAPVLEQVSVPQFRVLVLLSTNGSMRSGLLSERLGVHPSTLTRMADRLVASGWVDRREAPDSRREVHVTLTPSGQELVDEAMQRRRQALASALEPLTEEQRRKVRAGFEIFAAAVDEPATEDVAALGF
jgi:DNA-binding MarR family transcriptional regulator